MERKTYIIYPASMSAAGVVYDLFGPDNIDTGGYWLAPIYARLTKEEYEASKELLAEVGLNIKES